MVIYKVTKQMIDEWLSTDGTTNQKLKEAIDVIQELANGQYTIDNLNKDIIQYYEGNWKYMEEK